MAVIRLSDVFSIHKSFGPTDILSKLKHPINARFKCNQSSLSPITLFFFCTLTSSRHVPGSLPPFSLIPDPNQNKEDTSLISAVFYGVYIPLSRPIQFCTLPSQKFRENAQDPGEPAEPWIQDPSGSLPIFMGFKSFHQISLQSYKTL